MFSGMYKHLRLQFVDTLLIVKLKPNTGVQPEHFQVRGGFVKLGHSNKHFVKKNPEKKVPQENILKLSLLDTLKTTF